MKSSGRSRRRPLAVTAVAVVLAFAVVCPAMAASAAPADPACHPGSDGGSMPEDKREDGHDRAAAACCSSATVFKPLTAEAGAPAVLPSRLAAAVRSDDRRVLPAGPLSPRGPKPPLFVEHVALLI